MSCMKLHYLRIAAPIALASANTCAITTGDVPSWGSHKPHVRDKNGSTSASNDLTHACTRMHTHTHTHTHRASFKMESTEATQERRATLHHTANSNNTVRIQTYDGLRCTQADQGS